MAVLGGLDLEDADDQSRSVFASLPDAVAKGLLNESAIDQSVSRLFYVRMRTGEFDNASLQPYRHIPMSAVRSEAHLELARQTATKSLVLLENKNQTLPLTRTPAIAVVGPFADCQACYFGKYSPHQDSARTVTVAAGLQRAVGSGE